MLNIQNTIKNFNNAKRKLLKTNAAICFNKIYRINRLTPNYVKIKIKGNIRQKYVLKVCTVVPFILNLNTEAATDRPTK